MKHTDIFKDLYDWLDPEDKDLQTAVAKATTENSWFTPENYWNAIQSIRSAYLQQEELLAFVSRYQIKNSGRWIGLVFAGNVPLVGIHDLLCVWLSGNRAMIKLSEKDRAVYQYIFDRLKRYHQEFTEGHLQVVERLVDFDAVIATGSNNSARYFEYYFGKYPNIIRKNRNGVAVLDGSENQQQIDLLGMDMFTHFGLGCRNVTKLYVPNEYDFIPLLEGLQNYSKVMHHHKYHNNYDYHLAVQIMSENQYMTNGHVIFKEDNQIASPISMVHYQYYQNTEEVERELNTHQDAIQCVVSDMDMAYHCIPFGQAQSPRLYDYADNVDTMNFLTNL